MAQTIPPNDDDEDPQVMAVQVVNRNDFDIRDMFNGVPYLFAENVPVRIPIDAANHIFGWHPTYVDEAGDKHEVDPVAMRRHVCRRFGWNTPEMVANERSKRFYDNLQISPIMYRMIPIEVDNEGKPLNQPKPRANKLMAATDEALARN